MQPKQNPGGIKKNAALLRKSAAFLAKRWGLRVAAFRRAAPKFRAVPCGFASEKTYLMFLGLTSSGIFKTSFTLMKSGFEILLK